MHLIKTGQQDKVETWVAQWEKKLSPLLGVRRARAYLLALEGKKREALALARTDLVYTSLGMHEEAIAYIKERIKDATDYPYLHLKNNPLFDPLRDHPEFQHILQDRKKVYDAVSTAAQDL